MQISNVNSWLDYINVKRHSANWFIESDLWMTFRKHVTCNWIVVDVVFVSNPACIKYECWLLKYFFYIDFMHYHCQITKQTNAKVIEKLTFLFIFMVRM